MALQTVVSSITHPGQKRSHNEDFVTHFEPDDLADLQASGRLYIVADGVGGESQGEVASRYAAQKVLYEYFRQPQVEVGERLSQLIRQVGNEIYHYAEGGISHRRMATTMVAAVVKDDKLTVANVGDSRAYVIRNGIVKQITKDHSLLGERIRDGTLTEEESLHADVKNRITRSLGGETNVRVDVHRDIQLQAGDQILLCSDGLTQYTTREILAQLFSGKHPRKITENLIDFANQQGGSDNISVILIQITDSPTEYPTIVSQGDVPSPVDWDTMSTTPGKDGRGLLDKPAGFWVRIFVDGLLGLILMAMIGLGIYLWDPFADGDPTPSKTDIFEVGKGTQEAMLENTPSGGEEGWTAGKEDLTADNEALSGTATPTIAQSEKKIAAQDGMRMVFVPAGTFKMGSDKGEETSKPAHKVSLEPFWMDEHEVTLRQFQTFMAEAGYEADPCGSGADYPVACVSWDDARSYCAWADRRLPTEAEWEYAARGGLKDKAYPWGDGDPVCEAGAERGAQQPECGEGAVPVKTFKPNGYGLYDMAGNVWEWVEDWYQVYPAGNPDADNDFGSIYRVVRGGSGYDREEKKEYLTVYNRGKHNPESPLPAIGFRCAQSLGGGE